MRINETFIIYYYGVTGYPIATWRDFPVGFTIVPQLSPHTIDCRIVTIDYKTKIIKAKIIYY